MHAVEQQLRQFVVNNFLFGQGEDQLSNHDSFLEKGIVDSTGVLELVVFLEKQYRIKIEDEELIPANLDSIDNLLRFIEKKAQIAR
jgi:acyl carrier protein